MKDLVETTRQKLMSKDYDGAIFDISQFLNSYFDKKLIDDTNRNYIGEIFVNFALSYGQKQEYDDAIKAVHRCIDIHPTYYKAYSTMGIFYEFIKEYDSALQFLQKSLTFDGISNGNRDDILQRIEKVQRLQQIEDDISDEETMSDEYVDSDYNDQIEENESNESNDLNQASLTQRVLDNKERLHNIKIEWNMSKEQQKAYDERKTKANNFYYRLNIDGSKPKCGTWTQTEQRLFMEQIFAFGVNKLWGALSIAIPGRVGYRCSNYWKKMIKDGMVKDENYIVEKKNGKEKMRFLKKKEVLVLDTSNGNNADFFDDFRKYQFTVFEDPTGTFKNLPCQHPSAPIKRQNVDGSVKNVQQKKVKKERKRSNDKEELEEDEYDFDDDEDFDIDMQRKMKKKEKKKRKKDKKKRKRERKKTRKMKISDEFLCPINYTLMDDPVIVKQSGWTYERAAIEGWIAENGSDPHTRQATTLNDLIPNRTVKKAIEQWKKDVDYENNKSD